MKPNDKEIDAALVEIAVQAGYKAEYEADMSVGQAEANFVEAIYKPIMTAAIAAIRPHIEAAERERCAKIADKYEGEWHSDTADACARAIAAAIRSEK